MKYTFYIDSFLLYQMGINLCILDIVEKWLGFTSPWKKKCLVCIGISILSAIGILIPLGYFYLRMLVVYVLSGYLLCFYLYPWLQKAERGKMVVSMVFGFFLIGSILVCLQGRFAKMGMLTCSMLGIISLTYLFKEAILLVRKRLSFEEEKQEIISVFLCTDSKEQRIMALCDTGNRLVHPTQKLPIVIIEKTVLTSLFGNDWGNVHTMGEIPYRCLGHDVEMLHCVQGPKLKYYERGKELVYRNVLLAIFEGKIEENGKMQMILPSLADMEVYRRR